MPEDIIKGKIVFEGGGVGGGIGGAVGGGGGTATMSGSVMSKRGLMGAITIPITDVLGQIVKGFSKLGQISPLLGAEFLRMRKGLSLFLMPIGDTLANWVRPFAQGMLESGLAFYEEYKDGGLAEAILGGIQSVFNYVFPTNADGTINFTGMIENWSAITVIAGTISFAILGFQAFASAAAWFIAKVSAIGATGFIKSPAGKVALPAVLWFAGKEALEMTGMEEWAAALLAGIATALGLKAGAMAAAAAGLGGGAALAIGIPLALVFMAAGGAGYWLGKNWDEFVVWFKQEMNDLTGGFLFPTFEKPPILDDDADGNDIIAAIDGINDSTKDLDDETTLLGKVWDSVYGAMKDSWDWLTTAFETGHSLAILDLFPMLGDSMISAWTNKLEPSFLHMQDAINNTISQVLILTEDLLRLPNIDRTITYTIKYEVED